MILQKLTPETSLSDAITLIAAQLTAADIDEPRREARLLVTEALGIDLSTLILQEARPLGPATNRLVALLDRRCAHEPMSRILGKREFFGMNFHLNPATLDPRPDTETLVEAVLAHIDTTSGRKADLRILDIGTGTGAILLALLANLPEAHGIGVDLAPDAVIMARENAGRLGLANRAAFRVGDLMAGIEERFDLIVSNPPYIARAEIMALEPEVRLHDPVLALDGGEDGLDFYRRLVADAPTRLAEGGLAGHGLVAFEVGFGQADVVAAMMAGAGFQSIRMARDLGGIDRVVLGDAP